MHYYGTLYYIIHGIELIKNILVFWGLSDWQINLNYIQLYDIQDKTMWSISQISIAIIYLYSYTVQILLLLLYELHKY